MVPHVGGTAPGEASQQHPRPRNSLRLHALLGHCGCPCHGGGKQRMQHSGCAAQRTCARGGCRWPASARSAAPSGGQPPSWRGRVLHLAPDLCAGGVREEESGEQGRRGNHGRSTAAAAAALPPSCRRHPPPSCRRHPEPGPQAGQRISARSGGLQVAHGGRGQLALGCCCLAPVRSEVIDHSPRDQCHPQVL